MYNHGNKLDTQSMLYPYIVLAQCFALFPVTGIKGSDDRTVSFSWRSKLTLYAVFYIIINSLNLCFFFIKQINSKELLPTFVGLIYFAATLLIEIFFICLAKRWPDLMAKWAEVDSSMALYSYSNTAGHKMKVISVFVMVAAFSEHGLYVANISTAIQNNVTIAEIFEIYFKTGYNQIFDIIPYNIYVGVFMQIFNIYCTFAWNYKDLFIILISLILSQRFSQIVKKVKLMSKYKIADATHWRSVRENYIRLTSLCKLVDNAMTNIVILSFVHNLFVILIQFMNSLHQTNETFIQRVYFIYSFGFLIIRTICVCLYGAEIYHESRKPLEMLTSLPFEIYNVEVFSIVLWWYLLIMQKVEKIGIPDG